MTYEIAAEVENTALGLAKKRTLKESMERSSWRGRREAKGMLSQNTRGDGVPKERELTRVAER